MNNKKFWIIITILVLIFLGLLFWPTGSNKQPNTIKTNISITEPISTYAMLTTKKMVWADFGEKKYDKTEALLTTGKSVEIDKQLEIKKIINQDTDLQTIGFNFDMNRNRLEFNYNINNSKQIERGNQTEEETKLSFLNTMEKLKDFAGMEVKIDKVNNKQFLFPWWVSSDGKSTDAREILADYFYKDIPIKSFENYMIKGIYFTNGKLIKMELQLPFDKVTKSTEKKLWSLDELKKTDKENFKIWRIDGGRDYELAGEEELVDEVKILDYRLEYIYDSKSGVVWPYYFLNGESQLKSGKATVTLIISAVKE